MGTGQRPNIAARTLLSDLPPVVDVNPGRPPGPGEAIVSEQARMRLQLEYASGAIIDDVTPRPIIGEFHAVGALADLERLILVAPEEASAERATLVYVLATRAEQVDAISSEIRAVVGVPAESLTIDTSDDLIALGDVVSGSVGSLGRQLALGAIAAGIAVVALTVTLSLMTRRRDHGRRRALGASRSALVALTLIEVAVPIVLGSTLGCLVGIAIVVALIGALPPLSFAFGAPALIGIAGIAAAVPPSLLAARQDPLRILRVP